MVEYGLLEPIGCLRHFQPSQNLVGLRIDEGEERRSVLVVRHHQNMVAWIVSHLVRSLVPWLTRRVDRVDDLPCQQVDYLDGAIAVARPRLVLALDHQNTVGSGARIALRMNTDEAGRSSHIGITVSIDEVHRRVRPVGQAIKVSAVVHPADIEADHWLPFDWNRGNMPEVGPGCAAAQHRRHCRNENEYRKRLSSHGKTPRFSERTRVPSGSMDGSFCHRPLRWRRPREARVAGPGNLAAAETAQAALSQENEIVTYSTNRLRR